MAVVDPSNSTILVRVEFWVLSWTPLSSPLPPFAGESDEIRRARPHNKRDNRGPGDNDQWNGLQKRRNPRDGSFDSFSPVFQEFRGTLTRHTCKNLRQPRPRGQPYLHFHTPNDRQESAPSGRGLQTIFVGEISPSLLTNRSSERCSLAFQLFPLFLGGWERLLGARGNTWNLGIPSSSLESEEHAMGMDERLLGMLERDQRPPRGSCENSPRISLRTRRNTAEGVENGPSTNFSICGPNT